MQTPVLETRSLYRLYTQGGQDVAALKDVNLSVPQKSLVAITGPSGSGKSTLLNLLAGLDRPSSGEILIDGTDIGTLSEKERTQVRRDRIGFVFQFFNLVPTLSVAENISIPLMLAGVRKPKKDPRFEKVVELFGLEKLLSRRPHAISGGEMQRTSIARAVVHEPPIVLADEPTGNLSSKAGRDVMDLLRRAVDELGRCVLLVTHNPRDASYADTVRFLKDGAMLPDTVTGEETDESRIADRMALLGI